MAPLKKVARIKILDVADAAGVSATTVSHALNGKGKVSVATREHVIAVADRLGYQPSRAARSLRTARTETLAMLLPEFEITVPGQETMSLDFYMLLIRAATMASFEHGYRWLMAPRLSSPGEALELGVDGVIVCDPTAGDRQLDILIEADIPVVSYERPPGRPDFSWHVSNDNDLNARRLLDHLLESGGTRIALVVPDLASPAIGECLRTYLKWCSEHGLEPIVQMIAEWGDPSAATEQVVPMFNGTNAPDAIFDIVPPGALRACQRLGLRVPDDVLIGAFVDTPEARNAEPPITAIDHDPAAIGRAVVEMLVGRIEGKKTVHPVILPSTLYVRESSRPRGAEGSHAPS